MRNTRKFVVPAIAVAVLGLGAGALFAQQAGQSAAQRDKEIVRLMTEHKMTLAKAIEQAEQFTKGQALSATTEMQSTDVFVKVTCLAGNNEKLATVDVNTGKVTEAAQTTKAPSWSPAHAKHTPKPENKPAKKP